MSMKKRKPFEITTDGERYHVVKLMVPLDMPIEHVMYSLCERARGVMVSTEGDGDIKSYVLKLL
ncbi:hypothetical protein ACVWZM_004406 [Bradyrhizobium sp. USDA 4501]